MTYSLLVVAEFIENVPFSNKTFKKRKKTRFLTLLRSQKHYVIFSNNVLQENITRKQFNRWLGPVSISQTALRDLQPRSKGTWERG